MPEFKFMISQRVCHVLKPEVEGMVTGITIRPFGVIYSVMWSGKLEEHSHYETELEPYTKKEIGGLKQ